MSASAARARAPREHRERAVVGELEEEQALRRVRVRVAPEAQPAVEELRHLWRWRVYVSAFVRPFKRVRVGSFNSSKTPHQHRQPGRERGGGSGFERCMPSVSRMGLRDRPGRGCGD